MTSQWNEDGTGRNLSEGVWVVRSPIREYARVRAQVLGWHHYTIHVHGGEGQGTWRLGRLGSGQRQGLYPPCSDWKTKKEITPHFLFHTLFFLQENEREERFKGSTITINMALSSGCESQKRDGEGGRSKHATSQTERKIRYSLQTCPFFELEWKRERT